MKKCTEQTELKRAHKKTQNFHYTYTDKIYRIRLIYSYTMSLSLSSFAWCGESSPCPLGSQHLCTPRSSWRRRQSLATWTYDTTKSRMLCTLHHRLWHWTVLVEDLQLPAYNIYNQNYCWHCWSMCHNSFLTKKLTKKWSKLNVKIINNY